MAADDWLYKVWVLLLLVLLCVRVWGRIIRMLIKYERDKQADGVGADDSWRR